MYQASKVGIPDLNLVDITTNIAILAITSPWPIYNTEQRGLIDWCQCGFYGVSSIKFGLEGCRPEKGPLQWVSGRGTSSWCKWSRCSDF
jgi:hypothetical protein